MSMTWTELKVKMEDDYKSGAFLTMQSYSVSDSGGSRSITYRSYDEWKKAYDLVCQKAAEETGKPLYKARMRGGIRSC